MTFDERIQEVLRNSEPFMYVFKENLTKSLEETEEIIISAIKTIIKESLPLYKLFADYLQTIMVHGEGEPNYKQQVILKKNIPKLIDEIHKRLGI